MPRGGLMKTFHRDENRVNGQSQNVKGPYCFVINSAHQKFIRILLSHKTWAIKNVLFLCGFIPWLYCDLISYSSWGDATSLRLEQITVMNGHFNLWVTWPHTSNKHKGLRRYTHPIYLQVNWKYSDICSVREKERPMFFGWSIFISVEHLTLKSKGSNLFHF